MVVYDLPRGMIFTPDGGAAEQIISSEPSP